MSWQEHCDHMMGEASDLQNAYAWNCMNRRGDGVDGENLVSAFKAMRIPARLKSTKLVGCPICEHYHPQDFNGDCREDGNRFTTPNDVNDIAMFFSNGDPGTDQIEADKFDTSE